MVLASALTSLPVPLASAEIWVFMGLGFAVWGLFILLARTAEGHREHAAATDRKRCRNCQVEHPGFAAFCRQCGRRF